MPHGTRSFPPQPIRRRRSSSVSFQAVPVSIRLTTTLSQSFQGRLSIASFFCASLLSPGNQWRGVLDSMPAGSVCGWDCLMASDPHQLPSHTVCIWVGRMWSLVECCFTSTETVGLLRTGAQDIHLDFHTAPELGGDIIYSR